MGLKIDILCSSLDHPVNPWLTRWKESREGKDTISLLHSKKDLNSGDVLFLIACSEMIGSDIRERFKQTVVIHSSDLPEGRGWSPQVWQIVNGARKLVVSALVAEEPVDSGAIWAKQEVVIPSDALIDEINAKLFKTWVDLMTRVSQMIVAGDTPQKQPDKPTTYWPRRRSADSELDPQKTIAEQFDLMRVCDPSRYPAYFKLRGHKYKVKLEKMDDVE